MSDYPLIELARTGGFLTRWEAVVRYGPEEFEWCCLSLSMTRRGAIRTARWKWKQRQKPYHPPVVVERLPL